ncbi:hypothetical protein Cgig2_027035 [Carnegiea gigantea]|uniref:Bidirectional sugar transporter SWEET n=1 Tax=Carnegiea gigantea TaxID=171969 RepID=A0A9Q1QET2_9CARY|nr:hypothetical protein Cgig2_027035 [Carnegiea gigantea]
MALHIGHSGLAVTIVGVLGNVISVMVYLAPLPTYYRIYKKKSTQGFQSVPYVVALFSAMLWLYYALLKEEEYFLISINSVGIVIETLYIGFYFAYAPTKAKICTAKLVFALNLGVFSIIVIVIQLLLGNSSNRIHVLGYLCAIVTTSVFAAPLTIMGLKQAPIPNIFGFVLGLLQMVLYALYKNCCFSNNLDTNVADSGKNESRHQQQIYSEKPAHDKKADRQDSSNDDHNKLAALDHAV